MNEQKLEPPFESAKLVEVKGGEFILIQALLGKITECRAKCDKCDIPWEFSDEMLPISCRGVSEETGKGMLVLRSLYILEKSEKDLIEHYQPECGADIRKFR